MTVHALGVVLAILAVWLALNLALYVWLTCRNKRHGRHGHG